MRVTRSVGFVVVLVLAAASGMMTPLGAAGPADHTQNCHGPAASRQSGRATLTPGVNGLSIRQQVAFQISLFDCSPAAKTRGAGTLKSTLTTHGKASCAMLAHPKVLTGKGKVIWKNEKTSTLALTLSMTGKTRLINASGKVSAGLFKGHKFTGQFKYKVVVSPHGVSHTGDGFAQACANKVLPGKSGRIVVAVLELFTTKHFTIF